MEDGSDAMSSAIPPREHHTAEEQLARKQVEATHDPCPRKSRDLKRVSFRNTRFVAIRKR
jgi:hypothetical protein